MVQVEGYVKENTETPKLADSAAAMRLIDHVDRFRIEANQRLALNQQVEFGQFLTPPAVAELMASMFQSRSGSLRLLDAGAGTGGLTAAFVEAACKWTTAPDSIEAVEYEIDTVLMQYLGQTNAACREHCVERNVRFLSEPRQSDFIECARLAIKPGLFFGAERADFDFAILNPPYRKIGSDSATRLRLREVGIETSNLYSAFLALAVLLLKPGGQLVAISPRSFCNGPYFQSFRDLLFRHTRLVRVHVFESRRAVFADNGVLQENIIFHAVKDANSREGSVTLVSSEDATGRNRRERTAPYGRVVRGLGAHRFVHLATDVLSENISEWMESLPASLGDLGVNVSTGRVVEFRSKKFLHMEPTAGSVPLLYPGHLTDGAITWPMTRGRKQYNAIERCPETEELLVPNETYVLVKRFTSKEERRRVVAARHDPAGLSSLLVGLENHLNYFHRNGGGLPLELAKGLSAFLNSTPLDTYFRQFSGLTQVNATDLRSLRYPSREQLESIGRRSSRMPQTQSGLDELIHQELFSDG